MADPEFKELRSIFLSGLGSCPTANLTNMMLFTNMILTPGEMVMQDRLGDVTILVARELAERFTETNGLKG